MSSVPYYNQNAHLLPFIARLEEQGQPQPHGGPHGPHGHHHDNEPGPSMPWGHDRRTYFRHVTPAGPPPPDHEEGQPAAEGDDTTPTLEGEQAETQEEGGRKRGHPHAGRGRSGWGGRGRGGCGSRGGGHWGHGARGGGAALVMGGGPLAMPNIGQLLPAYLLGENQTGYLFGGIQSGSGGQDWSPEVDVFDTETSFVVHASLAGAKKEDIAVSWDAEKSELTITGVIQRPGDEDFLKTLKLGERKVGAFERKVRLGNHARPAQIDIDGITAKLEEGVLRIEVPKEDKDYVDIKKVDIE